MRDFPIPQLLKEALSNLPWPPLSDVIAKGNYSDPANKNRRYYEILKDLSSQEAARVYLLELRDEIVRANPDLSMQARQADIVDIHAYEDHTSVRLVHGSQPVILIDSGLQSFLSRMNDTFLLGEDAGKYSRTFLTKKILVYHAAIQKPPPVFELIKNALRKDHDEEWVELLWNTYWATPETPTSPSPELSYALARLTALQESFVVAHELAHIHLHHLDETFDEVGDTFGLGPLPPDVAMWIKRDKVKVYKEIAADDLAMELCLRASGGGRQAETQLLLTAIYHLLWYYRWLETTIVEATGVREYTWLPRYFNFRHKVRSKYEWGPPAFVAEASLWLEQNMERGAMEAVAVFSRLYKQKATAD